MIEVQDIFVKYGKSFLANHPLSRSQYKAFNAILRCRTAALGSHVDVCNECGHQEISYNSCRNRNCPKCQTIAKQQWIEKQEQYLLNVGYFHVVFTLPDDLNPVVYHNQDVVYSLFFKAVSEALLELCGDSKYLGAKPGITTVLHTWGQNLSYHPHIHCIVTGGGLTDDGKWLNSRKKFFVPVKVLSKKFRGKFMFYLRKANLNFYGATQELNNPAHFDSFVSGLYQKNWVTYCKPPFEDASKVVRYLGRYTHRITISNNRIKSLDNGMVTFSWRDYKDSNKVKNMTLPAEEFIRRFMMHVLPLGLRKIRHYGILASRDKSKRIKLCIILTATKILEGFVPRKPFEILKSLFGDDFNLCPKCGIGHLSRASPVAITA